MVLAPKVAPRRQPRTRSKLKPKWALTDARFKELYPKNTLQLCIEIIQKEFPNFEATLAQYIRRVEYLNIYKYNTRKSSRHDDLKRRTQVALQRMCESHRDDVSKSSAWNHAAYPNLYAPSSSEAQSERHWHPVGNCAPLMEEVIYNTAGTHGHTQSGSTVFPSESMIPFRSHIEPGVPFAVTGPSSIGIHCPLEVSHVPCAHNGEYFQEENTVNNILHPWQGFGIYYESRLLGSGIYDNDADEYWWY